MVVPANSPIKNAKDLAEAVKKDVAKVTFAGGSAGGVDHIMAALFVGAAGGDASKVNYVPFSGGGESLAAILGGKVTAGISGVARIRRPDQGRQAPRHRRHLAEAAARHRLPTFKEQGIDLVLANWRSVFGAPGINDAQKKTLARARRQAGEVQRLEGHAQAEGLGRRLSGGRRLRQVPGGRADARRRRDEDGRLGEVTTASCPGRSAARSGAPLIRGRSKGITS